MELTFGLGQVLMTDLSFSQTIASSSSTALLFLLLDFLVVVVTVVVTVVVAVVVAVVVVAVVVEAVVVVPEGEGGNKMAMGLMQPWDRANRRETHRRVLYMLVIWAQRSD